MRNMHGEGSFKVNDFLGWSDLVAHQEEGNFVSGLVRQTRAARRLRPDRVWRTRIGA